MSDPLKIEIVMLAVQRRVLPLRDETAVEHAVRLYKIAGDCMAALEAKDAVEPTPAEPAASAVVTFDARDWVWTKPTRAPYVTSVQITKQLKD